MFDISFAEVLIIAVVALVVIGPERLPKTVRTLGHLMGRAQRYVSEIKADVQREMELEELRKVQQSVQDISQDIEKSVQSAVQETEKTVKQAEGGMREMESELNRIANDKPTEGKSAEQVAANDAVSPATTGAGAETAAESKAGEPKVESPVTVPASLRGEVELSIPDALPTSNRKPGE